MVVTYKIRDGEQLMQRSATQGMAPYVPRMGETVRISIPQPVGIPKFEPFTVFEVIVVPNQFEDAVTVVLDPQGERHF